MKVYNVEESILKRQLCNGGIRQIFQQNNQILFNTEEIILTVWILDLVDCDYPLKLCHIEYIVNQLLSTCYGFNLKVNKYWIQQFITKNPEI